MGHSLERQKEREATIMSNLPTLALDGLQPDEFPKRHAEMSIAAAARETVAEKQSFVKEGAPDKTLSADWRAVSTFTLPLVPKGGTIVDLGGSGGQLARFMALSRNDVKAVVIESDPVLYAEAVKNIKKEGLENRIEVRRGPVDQALDKLGQEGHKVDAITSIYRTHTQTDAQNIKDFAAMGRLAAKTGASLLTHDLHRPNAAKNIKTMTEIFPEDSAPKSFREGYANALKGSYRAGELEGLLEAHTGHDGWYHMPAAPMGAAQVQMHVKMGTHVPAAGTVPDPVFPAGDPEYVKIGDGMAGVMKAGGLLRQAQNLPERLSAGVVVGLQDLSEGLKALSLPISAHAAEPDPRKMRGPKPSF